MIDDTSSTRNTNNATSTQDLKPNQHTDILEGVTFTDVIPEDMFSAARRHLASIPEGENAAETRRGLAGLAWLYFETRMSERAPGPDDIAALKGDAGVGLVFHPDVRIFAAEIDDARHREVAEVMEIYETANETERDVLAHLDYLSSSPANTPLIEAAHALMLRGALKQAKMVNPDRRMHRPTAQILVDGVLIVRDYTAIRTLLGMCRDLEAHTLCLVQGPSEGLARVYESYAEMAADEERIWHTGVRLSCLSIKRAANTDRTFDELDALFSAEYHSVESIMTRHHGRVSQMLRTAWDMDGDRPT
jgi:hypothetical protein